MGGEGGLREGGCRGGFEDRHSAREEGQQPRGLPSEMLIGLENTQPFSWGRYVFAHNGTLYVPDEAAILLGDYRRLVRGANDSEVYFALLVKETEENGDVVEALRAIEEALWRAGGQ